MRRALTVIAGAAVAAALGAAPASADSQVVVRGLAFPAGSSSSLAIVGCTGAYDRVAEPIATYLTRNENGPAGTRSLKYDLAGGNAVGSQHAVASVASPVVTGLSVYADNGTTGVAYVGYRSPSDAGTNLVWIGRAGLSAAAGAWQSVDATGLTYAWQHYDLTTQARVGPEEAPTPVGDFLAAHGGDGPGFYALGFGCDGQPFKIDALRSGTPGAVTTYDLEGYTSTTSIAGSATSITAGQGVGLSATLRDAAGSALPHGLLVLEAQRFGTGAFEPVDGAAVPVGAGATRVTVTPDARTVYRWRFPGTLAVDGSLSAPFTVGVATAVTASVDGGGADGAPLVVSGSTAPAKPGLRATLWRFTGKGRAPVATGEVAGDGTFSLEVPQGFAGRWRYAVTVPAADGNLAGASEPETVPAGR